VGEELILKATVTPENAGNKNVTWISSDQSVASVTDGIVTALKAGSVTITVKTEDGCKTASCDVTVIVPVASVSLDMSYVELIVGEEIILTAKVNPDNATNKNIVWFSDTPSVASVINGKITALSSGNAQITVRTEDGFMTAICEVIVKKRNDKDSNEHLEENEGKW
jgi:uncharacterized protein YjdB